MLQDSPKTGTGDLLISVQAIEPLKIPIPNIKTTQQIEIFLKNKNYQAIDTLVYEQYDLNKDEIVFIENFQCN